MKNNLVILKARLKKFCNIDIGLNGNWPFCYLTDINGKPVKEKFMSEHGWVIGYMRIKDGGITIPNTKGLFDLLRSYRKQELNK